MPDAGVGVIHVFRGEDTIAVCVVAMVVDSGSVSSQSSAVRVAVVCVGIGIGVGIGGFTHALAWWMPTARRIGLEPGVAKAASA